MKKLIALAVLLLGLAGCQQPPTNPSASPIQTPNATQTTAPTTPASATPTPEEMLPDATATPEATTTPEATATPEPVATPETPSESATPEGATQSRLDKLRNVDVVVQSKDPEELRKELKDQWGEAAPEG